MSNCPVIAPLGCGNTANLNEKGPEHLWLSELDSLEWAGWAPTWPGG
jgi:hypothetical protein